MAVIFAHSSQNPSGISGDQRFQSVSVAVPGRLMRADFTEHDCRVVKMSPGDLTVECDVRPEPGERIVAYLDFIGRVEGEVIDTAPDGFAMTLVATQRKREKLAAQLTWLANKHELGLAEDRRHERLVPRNPRCEIELDDGRRYRCRIIDLSLSGIAIEIDVRPAINTPVRIGTTRGRVVRHFQEGVAIEFARVQQDDIMKTFL